MKRLKNPVQLWSSLHARSPHRAEVARDIRRAQTFWQGEDSIWLLPWIKGGFRWTRRIDLPYKTSPTATERTLLSHELHEMAIQSECFDHIQVVHIDAERRIFAPGLELPHLAEIGNRLSAQMYKGWATCSEPQVIPSPGFAVFDVPKLGTNGEVTFEKIRLEEGPGPTLPFGQVDPNTRKVELDWPPPGSELPIPISPEAESADYYGKLRFVESNQHRVVTSENDPGMKAPLVHLVWPAPFDQYFPRGGDFDLCSERADLRRLMTSGTERTVRIHLAPYLSDGTTSAEKSWFGPCLYAEGATNVLADLLIKYGLDHSKLENIVRDPFWPQISQRNLPVTRIWGWLGYFWWELLQDLENGLVIRHCNRCGAPITGTVRKRFCGEENPDCYRQRRASARRNQRGRK